MDNIAKFDCIWVISQCMHLTNTSCILRLETGTHVSGMVGNTNHPAMGPVLAFSHHHGPACLAITLAKKKQRIKTRIS
jgi:hypothetical protein